MLSRVANSIYWINRYIERAENYARFIDVNHRLTMDLPPGLEEQWKPLVFTTGDHEDFEKKYGEDYSQDNVINFLVFDRENGNSIISCLEEARENCDAWNLESIFNGTQELALVPTPADVAAYKQIVADCEPKTTQEKFWGYYDYDCDW